MAGDAYIMGHDYDAVRVANGRCTGIFLDYMHGKYAETWVGSQTFLITRLSLSKS